MSAAAVPPEHFARHWCLSILANRYQIQFQLLRYRLPMRIGPWYPAAPSFSLLTSHLCRHPVLHISVLPQSPLATLQMPKNKIVYTPVSILNISRQSLVFLDARGSKTSTSFSNLACLIITSCVWTVSGLKLGGKCLSTKQHGRCAASLLLCVHFIKLRDKQADMRDYSVEQPKWLQKRSAFPNAVYQTWTKRTVGTGI